MKELRSIYNNGQKEDKKYFSVGYYMINEFTEQYRELEKCLYIKDLDEKESKLKELLKNGSGSHFERVNRNPYKDAEELGLSEDEYNKWKEEPFIYGAWVWDSIKRETILHNYINKILQTADKLAREKGEYTAICYLIDERFKWHGDLFDNDIENYFFSEECTHFIFDVLHLKEAELAKISGISVSSFEMPKIKPLRWNANKTALGTLFGILHKEKIITGTKVAIQKGLFSMFENLSYGTLEDNVGLKMNEAEGKIKYDVKTEEAVQEWLKHLKNYKTTP